MSDKKHDYFNYKPSMGLAAAAAVIFILLTGLHGYQMLRTKTWYFIAFWIGGLLECIGYITRIVSANEYPDTTLGPYIIGQVTLLVAPSLLAASMYMELGRIIRMCKAEKYAVVRVNWLTKIFVAGDVVAFLTQAGGAGMLAADSKSTSDTGRTILIVGLVIQVIFFGLFVATALLFHFKVRKFPTPLMRTSDLPWTKHLVNIYAASTLVLVRCIFRLIEYIQGRDGYLLSNEWPLYVFDTLLMIIVMAMFAVIHPSEVNALLNGSGRAIRMIIFTRVISRRDGQEMDMRASEEQYKPHTSLASIA